MPTLKFLLDEHISPTVAGQVRSKRDEIAISSVSEWLDGALLGKPDDMLLAAAAREGWTLVTYDFQTIPPLISEWAVLGRSHMGVIFVDYHTIPPKNFGEMVRALSTLWDREHSAEWLDRIMFLQRG